MTISSVAQDMAIFLDNSGVASLGSDLFFGSMNYNTDRQILIMDTGGREVALEEIHESPTFQLIVRSLKGERFSTIYDFARQAHDKLLTIDNQFINTNEYGYVFTTGQSSPAHIQLDSEDRHVFSCNYYTYRNPL